jgi:hypothetical protein
MALAQHCRLRLEDDRVIAPTVAARRMLATRVLAIGVPFDLVVLRCVDTHLHFVVMGDEARAHECSRRIVLSLHNTLGHDARFQPVRIKEISDQWYLTNAFWYTLRQERHHAVVLDPVHDASSLPDLVGLRLIAPHLAVRVRALLPRIRTEDLWEEVLHDLPGVDLGREVLALRLAADAAAAAFGLATLTGNGATVVRARRAAVHLLSPHVGSRALGQHLGIGERAVRKLRATEPEPNAVRAVRMQLALRSARARLHPDQAGWPATDHRWPDHCGDRGPLRNGPPVRRRRAIVSISE